MEFKKGGEMQNNEYTVGDIDLKVLKSTLVWGLWIYDNGPSGLEIQIWESLSHRFEISHWSTCDVE